MKVFLHVLVVFAMVMASASPACAFISGKASFIEICAADGTLKTVAVDGAFDPQPNPEQKSDTHHKKPDCAFCLTQTHAKPGLVASVTLNVPDAAKLHEIPAATYIYVATAPASFAARGPPVT